MRISDWSSDVCSSDLFVDLRARDVLTEAHMHAETERHVPVFPGTFRIKVVRIAERARISSRQAHRKKQARPGGNRDISIIEFLSGNARARRRAAQPQCPIHDLAAIFIITPTTLVLITTVAYEVSCQRK